MKRAKFYIGLICHHKQLEGGTSTTKSREVFKSVETPTRLDHGGEYGAVIGPFNTKRGAEYMETHPFCIDVRTAELKAKYNPKG